MSGRRQPAQRSVGGGAHRAGAGGGRRSRSAPAPKRPRAQHDAGAFEGEAAEVLAGMAHGGRGGMDDEMNDEMSDDEDVGDGDGVDDDGDEDAEEGTAAAACVLT